MSCFILFYCIVMQWCADAVGRQLVVRRENKSRAESGRVKAYIEQEPRACSCLLDR